MHAIHNGSLFSTSLFPSLSDFQFLVKVLILFLELSCLLDYLSFYWSTRSLENKGSLTSIVSSWINFVKLPRIPSLCSFLLTSITAIYLWSFQEFWTAACKSDQDYSVDSILLILWCFLIALKNYQTSGSHLHHHSSIGAMLWSSLCTCLWCCKDSHTFVLTVFWHYHTQHQQIVEHKSLIISFRSPLVYLIKWLVSLLGPQFSSLPVHGIKLWSIGTQGGFHQTHPHQYLGLITVLLSCVIPQQGQFSLKEDAHSVFVSDDFLFASNDLYQIIIKVWLLSVEKASHLQIQIPQKL